VRPLPPIRPSLSVWQRKLSLPRLFRGDVWAALALTLLVLALFHEAVFQGRVLYERDIHLVWYAQVEAFVRAVSSGCWPVWDPSIAFGQPLLADPSAQILYPPTWLNLVMRPWTYYTLFVVSHLIFSGIGLHLLGQRLGLSPAGALTAAALWVSSGPLLSLVNLYHHFAGATWMPWVLLAAQLTIQSPTRARALAWGTAMAVQILAGSADMCAMTGVLLAILLLTNLRWRTPHDPMNWRLLGCAAFAIVFALALSAVQWLPTLDVARRSARWELPEQTRTFWSVHPVAMLQTLLPLSLNELPLQPEQRALLFEGREPLLLSLYLGMASSGLVVAGLLAAGWAARTPVALVAAGAGLIALGRHFVVYDLAVTVVPPLGILRYPEKVLAVAALAWALLAGRGFDVWRQPLGQARRRWLAGLILLALIGAVGGVLGSLSWWRPGVLANVLGLSGTGPAMRHTATLLGERLLLSTGACLVVLCLGLSRLRRAGAATWLALAAACLALFDLVGVNRTLSPMGSRELYLEPPAALSLLRQGDHRRVYVHEYDLVRGKAARTLGRPSAFQAARFVEGWPPRQSAALAKRMYALPPMGGPWGIEGSYDLDVRGLYPAELSRLVQAAHLLEGTPAHLRLLRMGAVGRVVALHEIEHEGLEPLGTFPGLFKDPIRVYGVPDPQPRSYVVGGVRVAAGDAALESLLAPDFEPARELILSQAPDGEPQASVEGSSRIVELKPDRVRLEATLSDSGYVVLVDAFEPGWRVWVDGREARLLRANVAFRAVQVSAGRHLIELRYRPRAIELGLAISLLALGAGLALTAWRPRREEASR